MSMFATDVPRTVHEQRKRYLEVRERLRNPRPPEKEIPFPVHLFKEPPLPIRRYAPVPETRIDLIIRLVCEETGVSRETLMAGARDMPVLNARHIAMFLMRGLSSKPSVTMIGRWLGKKDHTTVINGIRRVQTLMEKHPAIAEIVTRIQTKLEVG